VLRSFEHYARHSVIRAYTESFGIGPKFSRIYLTKIRHFSAGRIPASDCDSGEGSGVCVYSRILPEYILPLPLTLVASFLTFVKNCPRRQDRSSRLEAAAILRVLLPRSTGSLPVSVPDCKPAYHRVHRRIYERHLHRHCRLPSYCRF